MPSKRDDNIGLECETFRLYFLIAYAVTRKLEWNKKQKDVCQARVDDYCIGDIKSFWIT